MYKFLLAVFSVLAIGSNAAAEHFFANVTAVDATKRTIEFKVYFHKGKGMHVKSNVAKDCVVREGLFRFGKPARLEEKDHLVNGLKNFVFEKVSPENPVRVNIYTADADDKDKGVKKGDVIKILVNPSQ